MSDALQKNRRFQEAVALRALRASGAERLPVYTLDARRPVERTIAPMLADAPPNCVLPEGWRK